MFEVQELESADRNGFALLHAYLKESWYIGKGKINLWVYMVVGIVGIGGLGVWVSVLIQAKNWHLPEVLLSLITCAISIIVSSCLDFIFDQERRHFLLGFSIFVLFLVFMLDIFAIVFFDNLLGVSYLLVIVSQVLACGMWWIANARNQKLDNMCNYLTPIGSVNGTVSGSKGDFNI